MENNNQSSNVYFIASSIIIAGLIISGAVIYSGSSGSGGDSGNQLKGEPITLESLGENRHIFGDPNAPVKLIEFSDLECPFCKSFHNTIVSEIIPDYITTGRVAWIYRHNPLTQIHPKAPSEAAATECVAELGGNDAFWQYMDSIFATTNSNNSLDLNQLPILAKAVGVDEGAFNECLNSGRYDDLVKSDASIATKIGARGTPYAVVINEAGQTFTIPGALPGDQIKTILDEALK